MPGRVRQRLQERDAPRSARLLMHPAECSECLLWFLLPADRMLTMKPTAHRFGAIVASIGTLIAGCAPTVMTEHRRDVIVSSSHEVIKKPNPTFTVNLIDKPDAAKLTIISNKWCSEHRVDIVHRYEITERKASVGGQVAFYLLSAAGIGLGVGFLADAHNIPLPGDPNKRNPVGRTPDYAAGGVLLGVGATFLGLGIGTSVRGLDKTVDLGTVRVPIGGSRVYDCDKQPVAGKLVALSLDGTDASFKIGLTDQKGKVEARWDVLEQLVVGHPTALAATVVIGEERTPTQLDLAPARRQAAARALLAAKRLAEKDMVDEAIARMKIAEALGADTDDVKAAIAAAPTSVARRHAAEEEAAEARRRWESEWGPFADWKRRPANQQYVKTIRTLLKEQKAANKASAVYQDEKQRNEQKTVAPSVVTVPRYPETTGVFTYIKILDRYEGEALFEASDGLFVLRLSSGDSFTATPGDPIRMTMYSRGEYMLMTNGQRLPVFRSGHSPARVRTIRGYTPNRSRERHLAKLAQTITQSFKNNIDKLTSIHGNGQRRIKSRTGTSIIMKLDEDEQIKNVLIGNGEQIEYCISEDKTNCVDGEFISNNDL